MEMSYIGNRVPVEKELLILFKELLVRHRIILESPLAENQIRANSITKHLTKLVTSADKKSTLIQKTLFSHPI